MGVYGSLGRAFVYVVCAVVISGWIGCIEVC